MFLSPLRLRVEQRISCFSLAERRGTYRRCFEELLGRLFVFYSCYLEHVMFPLHSKGCLPKKSVHLIIALGNLES